MVPAETPSASGFAAAEIEAPPPVASHRVPSLARKLFSYPEFPSAARPPELLRPWDAVVFATFLYRRAT
ncbi:hypothetical protein ACFQZC_38195 [Streptacidiphilus monticola]